MRSTGYPKPYTKCKARCSVVIGWCSTAVIGAFRSSLFRQAVPSVVRSSPVVVFLDRGHPGFWNFNCTIPVNVVKVKSYANRLFDPACAPM